MGRVERRMGAKSGDDGWVGEGGSSRAENGSGVFSGGGEGSGNVFGGVGGYVKESKCSWAGMGIGPKFDDGSGCECGGEAKGKTIS